jgi:acetyl esterase/lipase
MVDTMEMVKKLRLSFPLGTIVPRSPQCQINKQVYEYEGHTVDAYWINHHGGKEPINTNEIVIYFHGGAYLRGDVQSKLSQILLSNLDSEFVTEIRTPLQKLTLVD